MQQAKNIIDTIKGYTSTITAIFSSAVVLFGVFTFISQSNQAASSVKDLKDAVGKLNVTIETMQKRSEAESAEVKGRLADTFEQLVDLKTNTDKWHRSYLQYIKDNTRSSEELFRYIQGLNLQEVRGSQWDTIKTRIIVRKLQK